MAWNEYTWHTQTGTETDIANIICNRGLDPQRYLQIIPITNRLLVIFECTEEQYKTVRRIAQKHGVHIFYESERCLF